MISRRTLVFILMMVVTFMGTMPVAAQTALAFRTPVGNLSISPGQTSFLGTQTTPIDVSPFQQIRVVAKEISGSPTNVTIQLYMNESGELVTLLDTLSLTPGTAKIQVYDVPGTALTIQATAARGSGSGTDMVEILVYGH
jgi:hypothetical protein